MKKLAIGIDIGGTNAAFGLVDKNGIIVFRDSVPTNSHRPADELAEKIVAKINKWIETSASQYVISAIGVGAPNSNYYNGCIENPPNLHWKKVHLPKLFAPHYDVPVFVTNDANAAALGELKFGAAKGMKNFIEITLGTGLGSGLIINGDMVYGHDGHAGELGHVLAVPGGRLCGCGRNGCLETYASATGIVTTVRELLASGEYSSTLASINPQELTAKIVSDAAGQGDALALEAFRFTADILGRCMADAVAYLSPQAIIFFGGLALAGELLFKDLRHYFESYVMDHYKGKIQLLPSALLTGEAAVTGAAALAWHELETN